jgi:hypothetical protein
MSHHFDTKLAKKDPSMNICDMYLFPGTPGNTVMAMTVNADAGLGSSDALPDEALYAFRFDLDEDAHEDVVFKFRFGHPKHADGDEHKHIQSLQVRRAEGEQIGGDAGDLLVEGSTGSASSAAGVSAFVGLVPEMWAADAIAFFNLLNALYKEDRYDAEVFLHRKNFFAKRNVIAMVLEVPNSMIGNGPVRAWATASLYGHAPEVQICRWGLPLITHLYLSDPATSDLVDKFHASTPSHVHPRTEAPRRQNLGGLLFECLRDSFVETDPRGMTLRSLLVKPSRNGFQIGLLFFAEWPTVIRKSSDNSGDVRRDTVCNWRIRTDRQHHIISIDIHWASIEARNVECRGRSHLIRKHYRAKASRNLAAVCHGI